LLIKANFFVIIIIIIIFLFFFPITRVLINHTCLCDSPMLCKLQEVFYLKFFIAETLQNYCAHGVEF